ncbi:MAG: hypothetical protein JO147_11790 [Actinobacteria bacterium]|nr:hypothetical protein [Actinomycetota bacterium]
MIAGVAFCPHPPALFPWLGHGTAELDPVRDAARAAVRRLLATEPDRLLPIGGGPETRRLPASAAGSTARFGVPATVGFGRHTAAEPPIEPVPLSLLVGAWLLSEAQWSTRTIPWSVADEGRNAEAIKAITAEAAGSDRVGLLVLADGSARRGPASPGYIDDRANAFDELVLAALVAGDAEVLRELDAVLGAELLVAGVAAWRAAGAVLSAERRTFAGELLYSGDPYGVLYAVAFWSPIDE